MATIGLHRRVLLFVAGALLRFLPKGRLTIRISAY
jgi:hypothetical protein